MDQLYDRFASLLGSNNVSDNLGALRAIDELMDVRESASEVSKFSNYMRTKFEVKRDPEDLTLASRVLGQLATAGGAMIVDEVGRQHKTAMDWLHSERVEAASSFAAVLILKVVLRDLMLAVRERSVEALGACLHVIERRRREVLKVAVSSLTRIFRDPSLSSYHQKVVGSLMSIFKSVGLGCVPYLPKVHIAGAGDFPIADPCPLPSAAKMKGLSNKEAFFSAPVCVLGDLLYDKGLEYIETPDESVQLSNVEEIGRAGREGLRKGTYIRLEVHGVPFEMIETFDLYHPILVGGISLEEENVGYMQDARLKKRSFHTKLLKTKDPLTVSIGWRSYQTTPVYAMKETRRTGSHHIHRYTPENTYCLAMFWGPLACPNTGVVAVQNVSDDKVTFQITATGVILGSYQAEKIVMGCKWKGTPCKIIGNTALIKDVCKSDLDVAWHKNALITASGVRGRVVEVHLRLTRMLVKAMDVSGIEGAIDQQIRTVSWL